MNSSAPPEPIFLPLGDGALLIRFADRLSDAANVAAIALAQRLAADLPEGVEEVAAGLVSVQLRLRPGVDFMRLCGELRLRMSQGSVPVAGLLREVSVNFDGEDLPEVAALVGFSTDAFIARHNQAPLRVLATGFAPGFVYCGFHGDELVVPRREIVRPLVPAGTVLFAAGQTAIAATPIRTGWHVIGRTMFQNFDPLKEPPTVLGAGDEIRFTAAA